MITPCRHSLVGGVGLREKRFDGVGVAPIFVSKPASTSSW
jgi:hypothetical protein